MQRIRSTLADLGYQHRWPLTASDKGRRAFARHLRQLRQQSLKAGEPDHTTVNKPLYRSLSELIARQPYDRYEFDAHAKDVRFTLLLPNARGELIRYRITKVWLLMIVEVHSTAVMAWRLVFGQAYTALDVAQCFAKALRPWEPRTLVAPGMVYAPGATMPQNLEAGCISAYVSAMDNAMAHHAHLPMEVWADHHDGILHLGPAHVPEIRATIESLFKRFEDGALRLLPGGVIPARELGATDEATTSAYRGTDHPIAVQALEDLMDVIVTGHNISPLPARQYRSPIDILVAYQSEESGWLPPPHTNGDPNGKETGCRVTHLIEDDGPFDIACRKLLADGFAFAWVDRVPGELSSDIKRKPTSTWVRNTNTLGLRKTISPAKPLLAAPELMYAPIQDKLDNRPERSAGVRRKYQCPGCRNAFWGGHGILAQCVRCKRLFADTDPTTTKMRPVKRKRRRSVPHIPAGVGHD